MFFALPCWWSWVVWAVVRAALDLAHRCIRPCMPWSAMVSSTNGKRHTRVVPSRPRCLPQQRKPRSTSRWKIEAKF